MLASGLPEIVGDDEDLARFLTSSNQFSSLMVKPAAFLPSVRDRETSVFRHGGEPPEALWAIGEAHLPRFHGAAIIKAHDCRATLLDVVTDEPPQRHGAIMGWPWLDNDPMEQKAQQKELAAQLASKAALLRR